jgi:hypothetical protein
MKRFLLCAGMVSVLGLEAQALKLYLVANHDNAGDRNQVAGIGHAVGKLASDKPTIVTINTKTLGAADIKKQIAHDLSNEPHEKVIYVGAGEGGVEGIEQLSKHDDLVICLTSHMPLESHKDLEKKVTFFALPDHTSSGVEKELASKLIKTIGVAHNRHLDEAVYEKWKGELPEADVYVGVYLGGDAPNQKKELQLFTHEEADRLADYVVTKVKELRGLHQNACVLVLNGPRTGKHDHEGKENLAVHREGQSDHITESFAQKLADHGINHKVFDFQHDTPENKKWASEYNAFDLVAGAVSATKGKLIVPGESTSVISEAIEIMPAEGLETMPPGNVLVYHNNAMNDAHHAHTARELEAGRIAVLENYQDIRHPELADGKAKSGAANTIAEKLLAAVTPQEESPQVQENKDAE